MDKITMDQVRALDAAFPGAQPAMKTGFAKAKAVATFYERLGAQPFAEPRAIIPAFGGASTGLEFAAADVKELDQAYPLQWSIRPKLGGAARNCGLMLARLNNPTWPIDRGVIDEMREMGYESFVLPAMPDELVNKTRDWLAAIAKECGL